MAEGGVSTPFSGGDVAAGMEGNFNILGDGVLNADVVVVRLVGVVDVENGLDNFKVDGVGPRVAGGVQDFTAVMA